MCQLRIEVADMRTRRDYKRQYIALTGAIFFCLFFCLIVAVRAIELPDGFFDESIVDSLDTPVALAPLPGGEIVVLEQYNGNVLLIGRNKPHRPGLLYTFNDVNISGGNERGLLGVAVDPGFSSNGYLYVYYTAKGDQCKVVRLTLTSKTDTSPAEISPTSRLEILANIPDNAWNHNGGTLRFGPDRMLYLSIGDDASSCQAQSINDVHGAILRMDVRLSQEEEARLQKGDRSVLVPEDNPFSTEDGVNSGLIYAYGLRNPFRFAIDPANGDLLIADVGLLDFEEIDYLPFSSGGGLNFGWPFFEGPAPRAQPGCRKISTETYLQPVAYYDRTGYVASVISLCLYRPNNPSGRFTWPKEYFGDYFFTDYFQGFVRRLKRKKDGNWATPAKVSGQPDSLNWATDLKSVPDAFVGADGALYYLRQFDDKFTPQSGQLRRIVFLKTAGSPKKR